MRRISEETVGVLGILAFIAMLVTAFFWLEISHKTYYETDRDGSKILVRVNRLTGERCYYMPWDRWGQAPIYCKKQ